MCEFISWIEHDGEVLFLTDQELGTKEGKALRKFLGAKFYEDIKGHGAIRHYFFGSSDVKKGVSKECEDFATPDNFPLEIVEALKDGRITYHVIPLELLSAPLYADYEAKCDAMDADYYEAKRGAPLAEDHKTKSDALDSQQWALFKNPENRAEAWR